MRTIWAAWSLVSTRVGGRQGRPRGVVSFWTGLHGFDKASTRLLQSFYNALSCFYKAFARTLKGFHQVFMSLLQGCYGTFTNLPRCVYIFCFLMFCLQGFYRAFLYKAFVYKMVYQAFTGFLIFITRTPQCFGEDFTEF